MKNKSILRDYYRYYNCITFKEKLKIFLKAFVLPAYPRDKICPWIRLGINYNRNGNSIMRDICERHIYNKFKCFVSCQSEIGEFVSFPHPVGIVIGFGVKVGNDCVIYQNVTLGQNKGKYPQIGNNVVIFAGAKIIGNIKIGDNVIVGTNSVVIHDIPSNCIGAGNPAVIVKLEFDIEDYRAW